MFTVTVLNEDTGPVSRLPAAVGRGGWRVRGPISCESRGRVGPVQGEGQRRGMGAEADAGVGGVGGGSRAGGTRR